jgi:rRNA-processing protein FCF1
VSTSQSKKKSRLKVILDSNALFSSLEFRMDIFEEVRKLLNRNVDFILLSPVKHELELLASRNSTKSSKQALYALKLAEKCKFVAVDDSDEGVDEAIIKVAKTWNSAVFTNDRVLKKKLRDISIPVIYVRQKSRLDVDGLIL